MRALLHKMPYFSAVSRCIPSMPALTNHACSINQEIFPAIYWLEPTLGLLQLSDLILGVEIHFDQLSQKSLSSVISIVSIAVPPFTINCLPMMRRLRCNLANYR